MTKKKSPAALCREEAKFNKAYPVKGSTRQNPDDATEVASALVGVSRVLDRLTSDQRRRVLAATGTLYGFEVEFPKQRVPRVHDVYHFQGMKLISKTTHVEQPRDAKGRFSAY